MSNSEANAIDSRIYKQNLSVIDDSEKIKDEFESFWSVKQKEAFEKLCKDENIAPEKVSDIIEKYIFN